MVEADETYHGKRETPAKLSRGRVRSPPRAASQAVLRSVVVGLVERGGETRLMHMNNVNGQERARILVRNACAQIAPPYR